MSNIEWTAETWNPLVGCSIHTPGCTNCYAMKMAGRLEAMARIGYQEMQHYLGTTSPTKNGFVWTGEVNRAPESTWQKPLRWKRPRRIFVNSMSDVFHESVPDEWIDQIFAIMALCPRHTFQLLTKRADRMREYLSTPGRHPMILFAAAELQGGELVFDQVKHPWPLPNLWLGVSVEDQKRADERIPDLLASPAAVRWLSMEPLLGPVDLLCVDRRAIGDNIDGIDCLNAATFETFAGSRQRRSKSNSIDWVVVGGESGPGARPMHPDWPRQLRDACAAAGVPYFFKQWGAWAPCPPVDDAKAIRIEAGMQRVGKKTAGRELDGRTHDEYPKEIVR